MNYSEEVKKEILCGKEKTDGEKKAFASAFLRSAGTLSVNGGKIGPLTQHLYDTLTGIQWGKTEDTFGWTVEV